MERSRREYVGGEILSTVVWGSREEAAKAEVSYFARDIM